MQLIRKGLKNEPYISTKKEVLRIGVPLSYKIKIRKEEMILINIGS